MVFRGISPAIHRNVFLRIIKHATTISHLNQIHAQIIHHKIVHDLIITKLIQRLLDFNAPAQAKLLCFDTPSPDLFLYNILIQGLRRRPFESLQVYRYLLGRTGLRPNDYTYSSAIAAFSGFPVEKIGVLLHCHAVISGFGSNLFVGSALVHMYMNLGRVEHAYKVFDRVSEPGPVLWNTMIYGLVRNGCFDQSLCVFCDMMRRSMKVDSIKLAMVLTSVAELQELRAGMMVQALAMKVGCHYNDHVLTCLVSLYSKYGDIFTAWLLFGFIRKPDLVAYNAMISGFSCNNKTELALKLFRELLLSGYEVSSSTVVGLIPVFHPFGHFDLTLSIHDFCVKSGFLSNSTVLTSLITVYSRLSVMEFSRRLFDESLNKTVASWNAMISGYAQNGETEMAIALFHTMQELDVHPNPVTITTVLSACAELGALSLGKWVHNLIKKESFKSDVHVWTSLIDMYAKCGSIQDARSLFDIMDEKNIVTWNTIISGYGLHGLGREAIALYYEMLLSGVRPTGVTFLSVLHACSHAGLVEEGKRIFHSMVHDYGFEPRSEHYACMVDILGRAGKLEDAVDFINKMPIKPDPAAWGTLLGACKVHKNTSLAQLASDRLFQLDPENAGYYVLLSNIYSTNQKYSQAAALRRVARQRNLTKVPGCTLIEVMGQQHVFRSGDQSHPKSEAIFAMLNKLMEKMKDAGYFAETAMTSLHDVEEEEKELMVKVHSEKLAIAFGLIASKEEEIRIFKNLRMCLDCHNFSKFVSLITARVLIVRDANRFHRFENGTCSCGDYW